MPTDLANFVRRAGETVYTSGNGARRIRDLSAVKTNASAQGSDRLPRFWYMLPDFARRHRPDAFVPRVNQGIPWIEINDDPPVLIDANFSTIWPESQNWTRFSLRAFLNSVWCRVCMEALGTPLGGGALKLEATQLRRVPLPRMNAEEIAMLDAEGRLLRPSATSVSEATNHIVLRKIMGLSPSDSKIWVLLKGLQLLSDSLCRERQRNV
jgi:hypothetical protein